MRRILVIASLSLLVSACGFKMRTNSNWPHALRRIYYVPENPYTSLAVRLKSLLKTMNVALVSSPKQARYSLFITNDQFTSSHAEVVNANLPSTVTYTQTATITIENNHTKKTVVRQTFSATQSITLNANQIYVPNSSGMIRQSLNQDIQTHIYYWLTSKNIKSRLAYATQHKNTRRTS